MHHSCADRSPAAPIDMMRRIIHMSLQVCQNSSPSDFKVPSVSHSAHRCSPLWIPGPSIKVLLNHHGSTTAIPTERRLESPTGRRGRFPKIRRGATFADEGHIKMNQGPLKVNQGLLNISKRLNHFCKGPVLEYCKRY